MKKAENKWNENYEKAKEYKKTHGTLNVDYKNKEQKQLRTWLSYQRRAYKAKLKVIENNIKPLTDEQVKLLNEIGMSWDKVLEKYSDKKIDTQRKRSIEIKAYKFLKGYALQIKNEIDSYEDIKNINTKFLETLEQLTKTKTK